MALTKEEEKIVAQSLEHNRGDVALGRKPNQQRTYKQRFVLRGNIEPGDIVNRNRPHDNYQFTWVPYDDVHYFHDMKEEGYKVVVEAEWINNRENRDWYQPDKLKWRWATDRMLVNRDEFLMYRNEDMWLQEQRNRLQLVDNSVEGRKDAAVESASRIAHNAGIEVEIDANNGRPNPVSGVRRTTVI